MDTIPDNLKYWNDSIEMVGALLYIFTNFPEDTPGRTLCLEKILQSTHHSYLTHNKYHMVGQLFSNLESFAKNHPEELPAVDNCERGIIIYLTDNTPQRNITQVTRILETFAEEHPKAQPWIDKFKAKIAEKAAKNPAAVETHEAEPEAEPEAQEKIAPVNVNRIPTLLDIPLPTAPARSARRASPTGDTPSDASTGASASTTGSEGSSDDERRGTPPAAVSSGDDDGGGDGVVESKGADGGGAGD